MSRFGNGLSTLRLLNLLADVQTCLHSTESIPSRPLACHQNQPNPSTVTPILSLNTETWDK